MSKFSHIGDKNHPRMVDVSHKEITQRRARASGSMFLGEKIISLLEDGDLRSKKGPVFQTAIIAGIQAVKRTSELIPMCHPLPVEGIDIDIEVTDKENIQIVCTVEVTGKTGVEMEALTGVSMAALTIYDMCKAVSQEMRIREISLMEKSGGKSDFNLGH